MRSARAGRGALLAPYLDAVAALNPAGRLTTYPGSPALVHALLRPQDRLIACELEPHAAAALARHLARRPPQQGDRDRRLDRAQRLCAAEGAARPGADRSAVRAAGRICRGSRRRSKRRTANGRPASICCGTRSRTRREVAMPWRGACGGSASRKMSARGTAVVAGPPRRDPARRLRADRGQSALDACTASSRSCCRRLAHALSRDGRGSHRVDWLAGEMQLSFSTFPQALD